MFIILLLCSSRVTTHALVSPSALVQERGLYWNVEPFNTTVDPAEVKEIHVIFSNHLDVGFNSRAWCDGGSLQGCIGPARTVDGQQCRPWSYYVINANMNTFLPRAANLAAALRNTTTPFSYMTHPFIVAFYLDCEAAGLNDWRPGKTHGSSLLQCPNATELANFKAAVQRGDVWWHAFPHNPMPGLYDASLFNASLQMASRLANDLGVRQPTTYSQRDETGITRSIVPLLNASNVGMISLGAGGGSGGHPVIPDLFVWKDNATATQVIFVFDHGYGGGLHVLPSNGVAVYCAWNTDNGGPLSQANVELVYKQLRHTYPNAYVHDSTFDDFYDVASQSLEGLPVITQEIGDTWLYGIPSDPYKNVVFREMSRHRRACIETKGCDVESMTMQRFDRLLTKIPEHTWGEDTTWYLSSDLGGRGYPLGDYENWTNTQFQHALGSPEYQMTVDSWLDQRNYLTSALQILQNDTTHSIYPTLATTIQQALSLLSPKVPSLMGYEKVGGTPAQQSQQSFTCGQYKFGFGLDMSLNRLLSLLSERVTYNEPSFGLYTYQTLDPNDFTMFDRDYGMSYCTPTTEGKKKQWCSFAVDRVVLH